MLRLARERQSRHSKAHKQKRLAANEPLLSQTVSTDFFPPTSEVEQARTPSHNWMQPLEDISWCERARHQCIQCKVPTADVRDFMQHCTSAHEGFWQHRTDYVQDSILLNQATTPCCWCRATTHRPTLHAQYCIPVMNAALLHYETVSRFFEDGNHADGRAQKHVRRNVAVLGQHHLYPGDHTNKINREEIGLPTHQNGHKTQGRKSTKGRGRGRGAPRPKTSLFQESSSLMDDTYHLVKDMVKELVRLSLRHEQQLMRLGQDNVLLFTFQNKPGEKENILPALFKISQAWKQKMECETKPTMSLRVTVMQCICAELLDGDYHGGVQSSGDPTAVDDTGGTLEFSTLECRDGAAGQDRGPGHHARGVGTVDRDHPTELHADRCPIQVSGDPKTGCRTCGPPTNLCRGGGTEAARSADFIPIPRQDPGGGGVAASGSTSSSPSTPDVATGRHAQPLSQMVTALALRNPTNLCYLNSVVSVWLWLAAKTTGESNKLFGRASEAFQRILASSNASPYIAGMLAWRQILLTWPQLHQQNDAHEFWIYLQDFAKVPVFEGVWEARTAVEGPRRYIRELQGTLSTGVTVPLPQRTTDLDSCIAAWCRQPFTHALVQAPLWLCIHLPRYVEQAGRIYKNKVCVRIDPGNVTYVPIFCRNGTTVQWMPYRILAGITHAGRDTKSGHYRAFLSDAPLSPNIWFTDDGQPAKSCTDDLLHHIHHECYMCFLARV